ncbi:Protein transport protein Sec31A [Hordeum vulgare]|nr:Protein transport protein Sec31A [Hordeum vulgare]
MGGRGPELGQGPGVGAASAVPHLLPATTRAGECGAGRSNSGADFGPRGPGLGAGAVHGADTSWDHIGQGVFLTLVQGFSPVGGPSSLIFGVAMSTGPMSPVVARASSSSAPPSLSFPPGFSPRPQFAATAQAPVLKSDWDVAGGGAQVVAGAEGVEDLIPTNMWLKRVDLPGRVAFMSMPRSRGRSPRTGHEEGAQEPLCFYQQIKDAEDLAMLVIPRKFVQVMNDWLVIRRPPRLVRLSVNKWCEFWVQVQNFEGHMALGRGWNYFCCHHQIIPDDLLVLRILGLALKVQIYNHDSSIMCMFRCSKHICVGNIEHAT